MDPSTMQKLLLTLAALIIINAEVKIKVDFKQTGAPFKHFWKSTGLCPPDPKDEIYKFLQSEDEKRNLAYIGALPNRSLKQVRIHWLLNLIQIQFQMNKTIPPHVQFIKKPSYSVMGLLSLLGDEHVKEDVTPADPLVDFLATRSEKNKYKSRTATLLIAYVNNTERSNKDTKRISAVLDNLEDFDSKYVIYVMDNLATNPSSLWRDAGAPVFPGKSLRAKMRSVEEPLRLRGPAPLVNSTLEVQMNLTLPAVALIHVCSGSSAPPGRVTRLRAYNVTVNEVLLIWKDTKVRSKCIRTYEVEFEPERCRGNRTVPSFRRINGRDTIFLSYHHVEAGGRWGDAARGRYRVRAVDYWSRPGKYSKFLSYPPY